MNLNLTEAAKAGYEGGSSPFLLSSPLDMAWRAGGWCYHARRGAPIAARTGRGYTLRLETKDGAVILSFKDDSRVPVVLA